MKSSVQHPRPKLPAMLATKLLLGAALAMLILPGRFMNFDVAAQGESISPTALAQIEALIREKESRVGSHLKIDSQLIYEIKMDRGEAIASGIASLETDLEIVDSDRIAVDITASVSPGLLSLLRSRGSEIVSSSPTSVRANVEINEIESIASLPDVSFIQPKQQALTSMQSGSTETDLPRTGRTRQEPSLEGRADRVRSLLAAALSAPPTTNVSGGTGKGSVTSEGDVAHRAFSARGTFQINGTGVKIGVLSDGVVNLAASQALGDLPPTVTVLPGQVGTGDEGTAMLEIIHDLAPGAQLFFATAFTSITSFAANIRALRTAGCDIIVDDVFYFAENPFQDGQALGVISPTNGGAILEAVNDVTASGALYFSSAGNEGNLTDGTAGVWEGNFVDGGATGAPIPAGRLHSFGAQNFNLLTAASPINAPIALYWSDPLGGSANDYDLFRLNAAGTGVAASSTNIQNGTQDPIELISQSTANPRIVIVKKAGAADRFLHLNSFRGRFQLGTSGQTHGHSAAAKAFSCAATPALAAFPNPFGPSNVSETFTSDGPRRLFFQANGTAITPGNLLNTGGLLRQKPDITAADGVDVTGVGGFPSTFFGTSASAPHAAAIAGLIKSANPAFTDAQIRTALISSAIDIEAPGVDRDTGAGIIDAYGALQFLGVPGFAFLELATVSAAENPGDGDGGIEAGEGASLAVDLKNSGLQAATAVSATLTTTTPGVQITLPNVRAYPNIAPSGGLASSAPFTFTVVSNAACPLTINFVLTVAYSGGSSPQVFNIPVTVPPPISINSVLDVTPPLSGSGFVGATGLQNLRLNRNGIVSSCGTAKPFPGLAAGATGTRRFDSYQFETCPTSAPSCITVSMASLPVGGNPALYVAAYSVPFNPTDISQNFLADPGASQTAGGFIGFSFNIPGGVQSFVIVVSEVNQGLGLGASYTLNVSGGCISECNTPNQLPVAKVKNVQVSADATCTANASIDDGSFDPEGGPLTITQTPPGPYPIGMTAVLLTVVDNKGATAQATATVTVVDDTPPTISGASVNTSSLWPANHKMVDITVNYTATDTCAAITSQVLSVTSNEPVTGGGSGDTSPDWQVIDAHHVKLRAERNGNGSGRIYTIRITATDANGNSAFKEVTVVVAHDQGKKP